MLASSLAHIGHLVDIVYPGSTGRGRNADPFFKNKGRLRTIHMRPILGIRSHYANLIPEIAHTLSTNYDIVHVWTAKIPLLSGIVARVTRRSKLVVHVEDAELDMARKVGLLRVFILRFSTMLADLFANGFTVLTHALRKEARARSTSRKPIQVTGAGSDFRMFSSPPMEYVFPYDLANDAILLGLFCSLKGENTYLKITLEMMKHLDDRYILMVTGEGKGRAIYERMAETLGVSNRTHFVGFIPRYDQIPSAMKQCDVLLLPLTDDNENRLRWPGKLSEYMATGTPILTNPVGPAGSLLKDGKSALISPLATGEDLANRLTKAITNREDLGKIGKHAQKIAMNLDWKHLGQRVSNYYQFLIDK
jgi:glycosyltransferase involved in cell wall biosynthesis